MLDLDRHPSLQSALREAFETHADRLCLIEADRDRERARLTYRDVDAAADALAAALQRDGARRVAILMTNQSKWHVSACAALRIGAVLVPLDPKLSADEQGALLEHSGADTLIVEHFLWRTLRFAGRVLVTEAPATMDLRGARRWEEYAAGDKRPVFVERARSDDACLVYSSGTGGRAKGCVLTHGNYLSQCTALMERYTFAPGDRYLSILPTNHAIDFMVGFTGPYACGATVVHLRTLRPEFVRAAFPRYRIAYAALVPMVLRGLVDGLEGRLAGLSPPRRAAFVSLRALYRLLAAGRLRLRLARLLLKPVHAAFGGKLEALFVGGAFTDPGALRLLHRLGVPVANGYGLTEAGTAVTLNDPLGKNYDPESVGSPLRGTEVRIDAPDASGAGEVLVRGPTVMARYHRDPELTAETIVDGWLRTGDVGRLRESGQLVLVGRRKNMIVTAGGKNVYPEDVEHAFEGLDVREFCVVAAHRLWPGRDERLILVVRPGDEPFEDDARRRNRTLPDFKRVAGVLVCQREFPRTASLKLKRDLLAAMLRSTDPADLKELA